MKPVIEIYGAGLAGCEASYQATRLGCRVMLYEMKPVKYTPAHVSSDFAELVCSNSLRSDSVSNGVGLLKEEMRRVGSLVMEAADKTRVPAGSALAVDRKLFSQYITEKIRNHPDITVISEEKTTVGDGYTIVATGPLTSDGMANYIEKELGCEGMHFYDAAAPIVDASTIDMNTAFYASRYDKGDADYINCPMTKEQYDAFYQALITAEEAQLHEFDRNCQKEPTVFEGCMPVEIMARRGYDTLCYGPLKPVGLTDPHTGKMPFAVVQLRKENTDATMFNLVGFQTHLTYPEQRRVFRMIPGLENAEFLRYGTMHRNTYLNSPGLLSETYRLLKKPTLYFAGQMTGVEGYVESAGSGMVAGINCALSALGKQELPFPPKTMLGAMGNYVKCGGIGRFSPMNANFGIIPSPEQKVKGGKSARNEALANRALAELDEFLLKLKEG